MGGNIIMKYDVIWLWFMLMCEKFNITVSWLPLDASCCVATPTAQLIGLKLYFKNDVMIGCDCVILLLLFFGGGLN